MARVHENAKRRVAKAKTRNDGCRSSRRRTHPRNTQQHRERRAAQTPAQRRTANASRRQHAAVLQRGTFGIARYVYQWPLEEHSLESMDDDCTKCGIRHFSREKTDAGSAYNMCWSVGKGKVSIKLFENFPLK